MSSNKDPYLEWIPSAYNDRPVKAAEGKAPAPSNPQQLIYGHPKANKKQRSRSLKQR